MSFKPQYEYVLLFVKAITSHNDRTYAISSFAHGLRATISVELAFSKKDKGCSLCDADGRCQYPLIWWKLNFSKYPMHGKLQKGFFQFQLPLPLLHACVVQHPTSLIKKS